MSGRSHKPGLESSQLHLKPTVRAIIPPAPAPPVEAAHAQEIFNKRFAQLRASIPPPLPRKVFTSIKSFKPLSTNTSKKSIQNSLERNRKQFIDDLESSKKILLNEAAYILTLYNVRYPTMQLRIGDDTKINDIIKALQNRKEDENNTTDYDKLLEALQEIRKIRSIKEGGKRCKTRRKRRRTTRSSK